MELVIDGQVFLVEVGDVSRSPVRVVVNGVEKMVTFREATAPQAAGPATAAAASAPTLAALVPATPATVASPPPAQVPAAGATVGETIVAPMAGKILSVRVQVGDTVQQGDPLCTLEAMKMEMPISATIGGVVQAVHVGVGQSVALAALLVTIG